MEKVEKDPGEARGPEHQEDKNGSSSQAAEAGVEVHQEIQEEQLRKQSQGEEIEESEEMVLPQRILNLQRELPVWVTNIQAAADAQGSLRRTNRDKENRLRLELVESFKKSTKDEFEELSRKWATDDPELQEALNKQQELCLTILEDKKTLINELQQELKLKDDQFARDLKKNAGELGLMMERMEDVIKILTQAYKEELASFERIYQQESDVLLTTDKTEREHRLNELLDKELARLTLRQRKVEDTEEKVRDLLFKTFNLLKNNGLENEKSLVQKRVSQSLQARHRLTKLKEEQVKKKTETVYLAPMKNRLLSLKRELTHLKVQCRSNVKHFTERSRQLSDRHKRNIKASEHTQKKIGHFAVADRKQFEEMWLMLEDEVKQLVEKTLLLDSVICKQHLGLAWERPHMAFMEQTGPIQPQKQAQSPAQRAVSTSFHTMQASQGRQRMMDASVGPTLETYTDTGVHKEDAAGQIEGGVAVEEGEPSNEAVKKAMELLCDEAGFPLEEKPLSLLAPLEEEEQTVVKLGPLLKQHVSSRETSAHHLSQEAYWESMGNIISEDKVKVWEAAENKLKQYHAKLTEVSELVTETQGLEQQNAELRRLLQQQHL
ncbi:dynein regulatory complex protein 1-like [Notolabrus celidotus]|uniref:dynein regulatory complex protein 1-like n=1 Tax=Notolabrus celidotus TaxID=1203425 RepID=UPI0014905787|nr:dynein regulatory complex protein 1-like [Notolabrus celidotus]XP_034560647.1 dynein regulatory complex protein 1-like [Notolabrus celidotus]